MTVRIAGIDFDHNHYDREVDVLYLSAGPADRAVDFDASPEGHALRYDDKGRLMGITILHPRWLLEQDGEIRITLPESVSAATIAPALA